MGGEYDGGEYNSLGGEGPRGIGVYGGRGGLSLPRSGGAKLSRDLSCGKDSWEGDSRRQSNNVFLRRTAASKHSEEGREVLQY